ncbi:MAG: diguanylate cyclase [Lachnospiraceae bacterium]|nr:diguanylate cyclase [Lachnospiraceae bacterium]
MGSKETADWVIVVDDDMANLKMAGKILSSNGMRVTALQSGKALLEYIKNGSLPDLVLLDILMPEMDGFETLKRLRDYERDNNTPEIPVIFLTAGEDKEIESRGFEMGALDFMRKPFEPEVLVFRIKNILSNTRKIMALSDEASSDCMTGLLNKNTVTEQISKACMEAPGAFLILDLDNFKLVNDIYGHEAGDKILKAFAELLKRHFRANDIVGRFGGDEFVTFLHNTMGEEAIKKVVRRLGEGLMEAAMSILGQNMTLPLGVSAGAAITKGSTEYSELFEQADKALLFTKQNGKHSCTIYKENDSVVPVSDDGICDIKLLDSVLNERNVMNHALWLGKDEFASVYRYLLRFLSRYGDGAYKVLFTITPTVEDMRESEFTKLVDNLGEILKGSLRSSDIMMQNAPGQFFLFLPMVNSDNINKVIARIIVAWEHTEDYSKLKVTYETEAVVN